MQTTWEYPLSMATYISAFQHCMPYTHQFVMNLFLCAQGFFVFINYFGYFLTLLPTIVYQFFSFIDRKRKIASVIIFSYCLFPFFYYKTTPY